MDPRRVVRRGGGVSQDFVTVWAKCVLQRDPYSEYHPSGVSLPTITDSDCLYYPYGRNTW